MTIQAAPPVVQCADRRFTRVGWWHDDPNMCNHFAHSTICTNAGGVWRPVYVLTADGGADD